MSWRHALTYVALAGALGLALWATAPSAPPPSAITPAALPPERAIEMMAIETDGQRLRVRRTPGGWEVLEPAGREISPDLVERLLAAVFHSRIEAVAADAEQGEFGLDRPRARVTLWRHTEPPIVLILGNDNPTATAVYGQLEGDPRILLVGLDIWHYVTLATR
jgi:hypothetical protein